ncbi:hypothetical protein VTI28DRAFT_5702 [Corynascus sepedonium]
MSNPNPKWTASCQGEVDMVSSTASSTVSCSSTATLGRSSQANTGKFSGPATAAAAGSRPKRSTYIYNVDTFLKQNMFEDGTLHGRVPDHGFCPCPHACIPLYKDRAANIVADFEAKFDTNGNVEP